MTRASQRRAAMARVPLLVGVALGLVAGLQPARAAADPVAPIAIEASAAGPSRGGRPIALDVSAQERGVDPALVRAAIARELGRPVLAAGTPEAATAPEQLVIRPVSTGRVLVRFRDAQGRSLERSLRVAADPNAASRTIALLAGNLARNEARDLAAALGTSRAMRNASGPRATGVAGAGQGGSAGGGASLDLPQMDITGQAPAPSSTPPTSTQDEDDDEDDEAPSPRPARPRMSRAFDTETPPVPTGGSGVLRDRPAGTPGQPETYAQRHGGRIAVMAALGMGVTAGTLLFPVTVGAQYRWRRVAVGLDVTWAAFTQPAPGGGGPSTFPPFGSSTPSIPEPETRVAISPMFWGNFSGGIFRVELGAGLGLMTLDGLARDSANRGLVVPILSLNLTARAAATIVIAVARFLDIMLINDAIFGLASMTPTPLGFSPRVAEPQFATNLALQWRFWR